MADKRPLQLAIYKGVGGKFGAVQFNFQRPHYYGDKGGQFAGQKDFTGDRALEGGKIKEGWKQREGAVFIEAASTTGKNVYDWENKITFACSVNDMGKIALALTTGEALDIMHDPGAKTPREGQVQKHVKLYSKQGPMTGGAILTVSEIVNKQSKEHKIPLSADECLVLRSLLIAAIPKALAW